MKYRTIFRGLMLSFFFLSFLVFILTGEAYGLELKSSAFEEGGYIPERYTGKGENISPALSWSDVPDGTRSFVLIMDDPDAPAGTWVHWVVYDIPGGLTGLMENVSLKYMIDEGIRQGMNSFRQLGYGGPYPPPGPAHRYVFTLYALDTLLNLDPGAGKDTVVRAMQGHILGSARLIGLFRR